MIFIAVEYSPETYSDYYVYPMWADGLCFLMSFFVVIWVPIFAVYLVCIQPGEILEVIELLTSLCCH